MAGLKVIDADGHIIERADELRGYLKPPFNKRGGPLTASEPWDRDLQETLPHDPTQYPRAPRAEDWLPYWLDRMDEHWTKRGKIETPSLKQRPSDCVREHPIFFSFEAEETLLPESLRYVGESHFVYATDIPHWDCEFPKNLRHIQRRDDLSQQSKSKILYENAKALYAL